MIFEGSIQKYWQQLKQQLPNQILKINNDLQENNSIETCILFALPTKKEPKVRSANICKDNHKDPVLQEERGLRSEMYCSEAHLSYQKQFTSNFGMANNLQNVRKKTPAWPNHHV